MSAWGRPRAEVASKKNPDCHGGQRESVSIRDLQSADETVFRPARKHPETIRAQHSNAGCQGWGFKPKRSAGFRNEAQLFSGPSPGNVRKVTGSKTSADGGLS